jgi:hypothetical protein
LKLRVVTLLHATQTSCWGGATRWSSDRKCGMGALSHGKGCLLNAAVRVWGALSCAPHGWASSSCLVPTRQLPLPAKPAALRATLCLS